MFTDQDYIQYVGLSTDSGLVLDRLKHYLGNNVDIGNQVEAVKVVSIHDSASSLLAGFAFNNRTPQELRVAAIKGLKGRVKYANALLAVSLNVSENESILRAASSTFSDTIAGNPGHFSQVEIDTAKKAFEAQLKNNPLFFDSVRTLERVEAFSKSNLK